MWFDRLAADLRYALRTIRKTPGASAIAVLSLALGIGANTAIFSLVDTLLLKRLPVRAPQELYQVARNIGQRPSVSWNYPDYCAFRERVRAFSGLAALSGSQPLGFQTADESGNATELAYASAVSGNFFQVLGLQAAIGRLFNPDDDRKLGAAPYAVLGYDYWQRRFAGDPRVVGRTVRLNGYPFMIVGVLARGFRGMDVTTSPNLFIPIVMRTETGGIPPTIWNTRHYWWIQVVGRLAAGGTVASARSQVLVAFRDQEEAERRAAPNEGPVNRGQTIEIAPAARGYSYTRNTLEKPLIVLMVVVGLVLLIACANVASLMLARAAARQREMAVRLAVGASRSRLAAQLLVESLVLGLAGGLVGLLFAYGCVQVLLGFAPHPGFSQVELHVAPDLRLLAFTCAVSLLTGVLFGLAPALQSTRPNLVPALKDDGSHRLRSRVTLRKALVVAQVALSLLLLVGAGLFVRTLQNLRDVDAGFRRDRTIVANVDPSRNGYKGQRLREFYERLQGAAARIPGVQSVSLASITPLAGAQWNGDFAPEGYTFKAGEQKWVEFNSISPRYFETIGIPLVLGRDFREDDNPPAGSEPPEGIHQDGPRPEPPGPRVAIISESLARHFFAGRNPIGLHVCLQEKYDPARAYEVVGVVGDARYFGLREAVEPMLYLPAWLKGPASKALCLRTAGPGAGIVETLRRQVTAIDPSIPVLATRTLQQQIDEDIVVERLIASLSGFFGLLALLLAGVGLYGLIAYTVSRRTREIGIRMALGASRASVMWLVLRGAAVLVAVGAAIGVPAALGLTRLVRTFLYGVSARDPETVVGGVAVLLLVAALASLLPARRATRVEPTTALRYE